MKRRKMTNFAIAQYFTLSDAATWLSLGAGSTRKLVEEAGAVRKFGKRVLVDRAAVERYLAGQSGASEEGD